MTGLYDRCYVLLIIIISFLPISVHGQTIIDWQELLQNRMEYDDDEATGWEERIEELDEIALHPINLNSATKDDLLRLYFLNDSQIDDILAYVWQYGPMQTKAELAMIESIDYEERLLLQQFVTVEPVDRKKLQLKDILKYGKHDLTISARIPMYEREGDKNGYLGHPYRHSFRYIFKYSNNVKVGLVGAQDAGEPFFAGNNSKGYDYYSYFASLSNIGRLSKIVLGRYRANFGMGLVVNSNLSLGKMMNVTSIGRNRNNIIEHSSRSEYNYMQGVAAQVEILKNISVSTFASYRKIDATLNGDGSIRTILTTGYHRTKSEAGRQSNASESVVGMNIAYNNNGWHLGSTALYNRYSMPLQPNTNQLYRRWQAQGQEFWNLGVDYGYRHHRFSVHGETATGSAGSIATINRATYNPVSSISLIALQRFYGYKYVALHGNSFGSNSSVQNESGVYLGMQWTPQRTISLFGYVDYVHFAWPKYLVNFTSDAFEFLLQGSIRLNNWNIFGRYSLKNKEKNNAEKTSLIPDKTHRVRLYATFSKEIIALRTQFDYALNDYRERSKGWMISEQMTANVSKQLSMNLSVSYFQTDNYQSRLYIYEPGLLYQMSFPAFYGKGYNLSFRLRGDLGNSLMIIAKFSLTKYFDRNVISSGLQKIDSSHKSDVDLQLRYTF